MRNILFPLVLTLLIEVPLGALILKRKNALLPLILINALTNPALNTALMILFSLTKNYLLYWIAVAVGEIAVFIGEGSLVRSLCDIPLKHALIISTLLNTCSLLLGGAAMSLI